VSFLVAAGWTKAIPLLALTAVFTATLVSYASAYATERAALDWYLNTAFPDYSLTPQVGPGSTAWPDPYNATLEAGRLVRQANNISGQLAATPYAVAAEPFLELGVQSASADAPPTLNISVQAVAMNPSYASRLVARVINGSAVPTSHSVLLPASAARALNLTVGESVRLYTRVLDWDPSCGNVTSDGSCPVVPASLRVKVAGIYEPVMLGPTAFFSDAFPWAPSSYAPPAILSLSDFPSLLSDIVARDPAFVAAILVQDAQLHISYHVLASRAELLDPFDVQGNGARLGLLESRLYDVALRNGLQVYAPLETAYSHFLADRGYLDLAVAFSLAPVVVVAFLLAGMLEGTEVIARTRDLSVARSRGAGLRLLRRVFAVEACLEAAIGAILGLAGSLVLLQSVPGAVSLLRGPLLYLLPVPFAVCFALALLAKTYAMRRLSRVSIREGFSRPREVVAGDGALRRGSLFVLGAASALAAASPFVTAPILQTRLAASIVFGTEGGWMLGLALLTFPVAAAMYVPSATRRLLARRSAPQGTGSAARLFTGAAIRSGKAPDSGVLLVATIVLATAILASGLATLQRMSVEHAIYTETGGDVLMLFPGNLLGGPPGENNPPLEALRSVPGVASLTFASVGPATTGLRTIYLDARTYLDTLRLDMLLNGEDLRKALRTLREPGAAVANEAFAAKMAVQVGSRFGNLTITGVVPKAPGLFSPYEGDVPTLYTDYRNGGVSPDGTDITTVLVRLEGGADASVVATELSAVARLAFVRVAPLEILGIEVSPVIGSFGQLLRVGVAVSSFLLFVALGGFVVRLGIELDDDIARMRSRGLPGRSADRILRALLMSTVIGSVAWGLSLGTILLVLATALLSPAGTSPLAPLPGVPMGVWIVPLAFAAAGLFLAAGLSRRLARRVLGPRLRERAA